MHCSDINIRYWFLLYIDLIGYLMMGYSLILTYVIELCLGRTCATLHVSSRSVEDKRRVTMWSVTILL